MTQMVEAWNHTHRFQVSMLFLLPHHRGSVMLPSKCCDEGEILSTEVIAIHKAWADSTSWF